MAPERDSLAEAAAGQQGKTLAALEAAKARKAEDGEAAGWRFDFALGQGSWRRVEHALGVTQRVSAVGRRGRAL